FRTVLVPRVSGPLEIPPFTLSYFDPVKRAYVRARSAPLRLTVSPGDPNAAQPFVSAPAAAPGVTAVAEDIRYLKSPGSSMRLGDGLALFGSLGAAHALPFIVLSAALLFDWRRRALESNPRARRMRNARPALERRLREAEAQSAEPGRAVGLLAEALHGFLSDKLGLSAAGLTLKSVLEHLPATADGGRLRAVWEELDLLRFAPDATNQAEAKRLCDEIRALARSLEELQPR
ncbi:MAG: BatD family protein, partial [Elusimicrobia bacterium]|nr:BatD family protein [Elusimicrobiota bacterium]